MRCPKCTSIEDKVIDSRISREGSTIRRRRECLECGYRYSTTELVVRDGVTVLLVEQNARSALGIADVGVVLNLGRVVARDDAAALAADTDLRHAYLGF